MLATGVLVGFIFLAIAFLLCFLAALVQDQIRHSWRLAQAQAGLAGEEAEGAASVPQISGSNRKIRLAWTLASASSANGNRKENFSCETSSSF